MSRKTEVPSTMKAVMLQVPGGELSVKEVPVPVPGKSEVLVKISAAPVNPSDLATIRRAGANQPFSPLIPGGEGSGIVVAAGGGLLPRLWLGKRVACSAGSSGGTWAEYMVTGAGLCFPLRKKVSDEQGSMSLVNPLTAIAFIDIAREDGHRTLINNAAASALGRMIEYLAVKNNIRVINIVRSAKNREFLRSQGSEFVLDSSSPRFLSEFGELAKRLDARLLFDSIPSDVLESMASAMPEESTIVIYGNLLQKQELEFNPRLFIDNDLRVRGFFLGAHAHKNGMLRNMLDLLKAGKMMSRDMKITIAGRYSLADTQKAIDAYLANMSAGKVLLIP